MSIINAKGLLCGIYLDGAAAAGTVVSDFTVEYAQLEGVLIQYTSNVTVSESVVVNNDTNLNLKTGVCANQPFPGLSFDCGEGLHLMGASNSKIINNTVTQNVGGILLSEETGPNHDNLIANNDVINNTLECGITLASHNPVSPNGVYENVISHNLSSGNGGSGVGMFAQIPGTGTYENLVSFNTVRNNALGGIDIHSHTFGQNLNGNRIVWNTISGNAADFGTGETVPVGIVVFADIMGKAAPITGTSISFNTIFNESIDVYVGTNQTNLTLHRNNLLGGKGVIGVENNGTGTVDATKNYWGCRQGPGKGECTSVVGKVTFIPLLDEKVD